MQAALVRGLEGEPGGGANAVLGSGACCPFGHHAARQEAPSEDGPNPPKPTGRNQWPTPLYPSLEAFSATRRP